MSRLSGPVSANKTQGILGGLHGFQVVEKHGYMLLKGEAVHSSTQDASYGLVEETRVLEAEMHRGKDQEKTYS